jgi:hypothetical protein
MRPGNWRFAGAGASVRKRSWRREGERFEPFQGLEQLLAQGCKVTGEGGLTADQDIVEIGPRLAGDHHPRHFAQPAAYPVAGNGIADLAADGETDADGRQAELGWPKFSGDRGRLEHETGHGAAPPGLDAQEISAVRQTPEACRGQFG